MQDGAGVFMSDLDGSNTKRLTVGDAWISSSSLSFSPDGRYVAMTLGDSRLYTMRLDGSELIRRTDRLASDPAWSAVGPALFYTAPPTTDPRDPHTSIYRLDLSHGGASPARLTDPNGDNLDPTWTLLGAGLPGTPVDSLPPVTILGQDLGVPSAKAGSPNPRLPFLALDPTGIRRVQAAVGLRTGRGCRFLGKAKLGPKTSCASPQYQTVTGASSWANRTRKLPRGRYDVRIRATDRAGNTTKHPRRRVVRLR